jgi:hypothetical protein
MFFNWIANHFETFVSINHEANSVLVVQMARELLSQAYHHRAPYWMREGYVEEVFKLHPRGVLGLLGWQSVRKMRILARN